MKVMSKGLLVRGGVSALSGIIDVSDFFEKAASVINATGGLLLLFAATVAIIETLYLGFNELFGRKIDSLIFSKHHPGIDTIRYTLGSMVTFALEILVAADVIDTLTKSAHQYKLESLYKIAMVVVIRTALSYFLGRELEELEKKIHVDAELKRIH